MNKEHRYIFEKRSKKHHCPNCTKKTFVRYVDTQTGEYLPEQYGRCDRESKCSFHLNPYLDGYAKAIQEQERGNRSELPNWKPKPQRAAPPPIPETVFFDFETFKQTLKPERYEQNTFIQNLLETVKYPFSVDEVTKVIQLYRLGTVANGYRAGANTFPFIDIKQNVRAIQVKQFDKQNHTTGTDFLHSIIEKHHRTKNQILPNWLQAYINQEKRVSCLFGEHLLSKYPSNPVALVEAPKTAVYGALYFGFPETPESLIWLAVYNKSSFSFDKLKVLQGRFVYVFPDLSKDGQTFREWKTKAKEYERRLNGTRFIFSDLLEQKATPEQREKAADIADILINLDWQLFRKQPIQEQAPQVEPQPEILENTKANEKQTINGAIQNPPKQNNENEWSNDIKTLENYFASYETPKQPIKLNQCSTITDFDLFIQNHFETVKANNGNRRFLPYLNRLQELKSMLNTI